MSTPSVTPLVEEWVGVEVPDFRASPTSSFGSFIVDGHPLPQRESFPWWGYTPPHGMISVEQGEG